MSPAEERLLREEVEGLRTRLHELESRLEEPEDIVRAIRHGEVDAFVVNHPDGERIYSLRNAEGLYRALIEEMKEGAAVLDVSGIVAFCNPRFAELVGVERGAILGASIIPFVNDESRSFFDYLQQESSHGARREIVLVGRGGGEVPVQASMNRIRLEDCDVFGLIVTDLREQRRRQELLAENIRKDEFLSMLAHELRNPLAPISNAIALLGTPDLSKESFTWSRTIIERQVKQLARLLDDLLDVQRFTHGIIGLRTERTDLGAVVEAAVEAIRGSAASKSQVLRLEPCSEPLIVMADPVRLTQVVSNLLVNAVKFSPNGSEVRVSCRRDGTSARIGIADNGIGMPPELLKRVFEPFVQGDPALSRTQGGLGLGLTLVKRLVELHGGSVKAYSAGPDKGSEFVVQVPLILDAPRAEGSPTQPARRGQLGPRRILVVDDNEDSAVSMCALLKFAGHKVELASDGIEALRVARIFQPEVILLDLGLPGMDGFEVARHLRDVDGMRECRLIAVTGYGRSEDQQRTRAAGFSAHVVKPVQLNALLDVMASVCGDSPGARS